MLVNVSNIKGRLSALSGGGDVKGGRINRLSILLGLTVMPGTMNSLIRTTS